MKRRRRDANARQVRRSIVTPQTQETRVVFPPIIGILISVLYPRLPVRVTTGCDPSAVASSLVRARVCLYSPVTAKARAAAVTVPGVSHLAKDARMKLSSRGSGGGGAALSILTVGGATVQTADGQAKL